jgi:hypothetical protein
VPGGYCEAGGNKRGAYHRAGLQFKTQTGVRLKNAVEEPLLIERQRRNFFKGYRVRLVRRAHQ